MKISSFCLISDPNKFGYPYLESIKSFADISDELLVIDGGSPQKTLDEIQKLSSKIKIIKRKDLNWENEWSYDRMGYNVNEGYKLCTGDIVLNFGIDWVLHEKDYGLLKEDIKIAVEQSKLVVIFCRLNFILLDRYFDKSHKVLAINRNACKSRSVNVKYGFDVNKWGHGFEPICVNDFKDKVWRGTLLNTKNNSFPTKVRIFNYSFSFSTVEQTEWVRQRHQDAVNRYFKKKLNGGAFEKQLNESLGYLKNKKQTKIKLEEHPLIIQEKIKNIKPTQKGYDVWGFKS